MRIGIDARMIDNTGIGRYLRNLLLHLARLDTRNTYIVFINTENSRVVEQENVQFVPLKIPVPLYSLREQWWLPWEIRKWQLDIIHYPNFDIPLIPIYPSIVTIHDLIYYLYPDQCPSKIAHYYARFMLRQATRSAHLLITDSESSKQDLITHFQVPADKIEVILPAAEHRYCPPESPELSPEIALNYGIIKPYILYVGKHHPYKNIKTLIHAFNVHRGVYEGYQLVIAGKKEPRRENLYQEAESLQAGASIVFTDFITEDDLFELYQHARLFVFPSLYEGFGLPPLEAMACGVPVITSNAASLPEVVGDAAIQVEPLDVQGMADAMRDILTNDALWKKLQDKGFQRAQGFSWDTAAQQLLEIYDRFKK